MFVAILLAIVRSAAQLLAGAVITTIVALIFRDDLVAFAIATCNANVASRSAQPDDGADETRWTRAVESLVDKRVPANVGLQVMVNRLREHADDRLVPAEKRLEALEKKLVATMRDRRRARTAYRYQKLQVIAMRVTLNGKRAARTSTETSTKIRKPRAERELKSVIELLDGAENREELEEMLESGGNLTELLSGRKSAVSGASAEPESLEEVLEDLFVGLKLTVLRMKDVLASQEFRAKVMRTVETVRSLVKSPYIKLAAQSVFEFGDKFIRLTAKKNAEEGVTNVLVEFFPPPLPLTPKSILKKPKKY